MKNVIEMLQDVSNFSDNIKPLMIKFHNSGKLSDNEKQRLVNYYVESSTQIKNVLAILKQEENKK